MTKPYLQASALHYLAQRAASVAMLRTVLQRRAARRLQVRRLEPETQGLIEEVLAKLTDLGVLDDAEYAVQRGDSLRRRGHSHRGIRADLTRKGLARDTVAATLAALPDEIEQARRLAERRRIGKWRTRSPDERTRRRELQIMQRAGFSYAVAVRVLTQE